MAARVEVKPFPGGQTDFLSRPEFEVLFGGAAGPGKSWALVIDALGLQFKETPLQKAAIDVPSYRAVLFRRKTTEFTKLIDEARKYYPAFGARFIWGRRGDPGPSFTFPSGARIFICHLQREDNKEDHQGQQYQYVGFDELTQFTLTQYLYLFSRCRTDEPGLFPRVRSTTNPTGAGLAWVRPRFIKNLKAWEVGHFLSDKDPIRNPYGVKVKPGTPDALSRVFIPGELEQNLILREDPEYRGRIKAMGSVYEKALLQGDWWAFAGEFFKQYQPKMLVQPFRIPKEWRLIGSLDPGTGGVCSFALHAMDMEGNKYRVATYYVRERGMYEHAASVKKFIQDCKWTNGRMPSDIISGRDAWTKRDRFAVVTSNLTFSDAFASEGLTLTPAVTDRIPGWWAVKDLMERGKWYVFDLTNEPFMDELTAAEADERDTEDIKGKGNDPAVMDHALDEERYAVMALYKPAERKVRKGLLEQMVMGASSAKAWKPGRG